MVVKRFFINISMLFLGALLLQAKNIIERDMGARANALNCAALQKF